MKEAGAYIRSLRKARGHTLQSLADAAGMHHNYIWKLETGKGKRPGRLKIKALLDVLDGDRDEFDRLLGDELKSDIEALPLKERERLIKEVEQLTDELLTDPTKIDRWLGYGARLLEEDQGRNGDG